MTALSAPRGDRDTAAGAGLGVCVVYRVDDRVHRIAFGSREAAENFIGHTREPAGWAVEHLSAE
jgi:hypothetical protein